MGSGLFALAAFFLGWIGGATASPMMATVAGASLPYRIARSRPSAGATVTGAMAGASAARALVMARANRPALPTMMTSPVLPKLSGQTLAAGPIAVVPGDATGLVTSPAASLSI
jgi:hypothetical protein